MEQENTGTTQKHFELSVLAIVRDMKLANVDEVKARYKEIFGIEAELKDIKLALRRWKASKDLAQEGNRYKIADLPVWFQSLQMENITKLSPDVSAEYVKELEAYFKNNVVKETKPKWASYGLLEMTFEALDDILGGLPTEENLKTSLPRDTSGIVVPPSWLHGYVRDNQRLMDVSGLERYVGWGKGHWEEGTETGRIEDVPIIIPGKGGVGLGSYETVKAGSKFKVQCNWPKTGCAINSVEVIQKFFDIAAIAPIHGLGANFRNQGGRIKLLEIRET